MKNKEIENLLSCENCRLNECIQCEISYTDRNKIRKYIEYLERNVKEDLLENSERKNLERNFGTEICVYKMTKNRKKQLRTS